MGGLFWRDKTVFCIKNYCARNNTLTPPELKIHDARIAKSGRFLSFLIAAVGAGGFLDNAVKRFFPSKLNLMISVVFSSSRAWLNAVVYIATAKKFLRYGYCWNLKKKMRTVVPTLWTTNHCPVLVEGFRPSSTRTEVYLPSSLK